MQIGCFIIFVSSIANLIKVVKKLIWILNLRIITVFC